VPEENPATRLSLRDEREKERESVMNPEGRGSTPNECEKESSCSIPLDASRHPTSERKGG